MERERTQHPRKKVMNCRSHVFNRKCAVCDENQRTRQNWMIRNHIQEENALLGKRHGHLQCVLKILSGICVPVSLVYLALLKNSWISLDTTVKTVSPDCDLSWITVLWVLIYSPPLQLRRLSCRHHFSDYRLKVFYSFSLLRWFFKGYMWAYLIHENILHSLGSDAIENDADRKENIAS
jgi:hypothetical protein